MNDTSKPVVINWPPGVVLLTTEEVASLLGGEISRRTLEDWRRLGIGPDFIKMNGGKKGGGRVRYRPAAIDRWLDANERKTAGSAA